MLLSECLPVKLVQCAAVSFKMFFEEIDFQKIQHRNVCLLHADITKYVLPWHGHLPVAAVMRVVFKKMSTYTRASTIRCEKIAWSLCTATHHIAQDIHTDERTEVGWGKHIM